MPIYNQVKLNEVAATNTLEAAPEVAATKTVETDDG